MMVTGADMARILGLSKGRISQLTSEGVLEKHGGKYDVAKSVQAYIAFLETGVLSPELAAHRAKLIEQQTRRLKLANDKAEGALIEMGAVRQMCLASTAVVVQALEALPGRCANEFAAATDAAVIHARLQAEVRAARQMMADKLEALADEAVVAA